MNAVSSPPIVTSIPTSSRWSDSSTVCKSSGRLVGLAREMPMHEPPRKWIRLVSAMVNRATWLVVSSRAEPLESLLDSQHLDVRQRRADGRGADDDVDAGCRATGDDDG